METPVRSAGRKEMAPSSSGVLSKATVPSSGLFAAPHPRTHVRTHAPISKTPIRVMMCFALLEGIADAVAGAEHREPDGLRDVVVHEADGAVAEREVDAAAMQAAGL